MTAILVRLAVLLAVFASIFLGSQAFLRSQFNRRAQAKAINHRLQLLKAGATTEHAGDILRKGVPNRLPADAGTAQRLYYSFQRMVRIADIGVAPRTLLTISTFAFLGLSTLILLFAWISSKRVTGGIIELTIIVSLALTVGLPFMFIYRRKEKRRQRMEQQFPLALDVFTRALRAGHPVGSAIELLTNEMEDPIGSEFGIVSDEVAYGATLTDSLMDMADRWDLQDMRMFVVSIALQSETGGNLAEVLTNLSGVIRDRQSMYMKVRALSSEGRMSGWMLSVLPVFTICMLFLLNPQFYLAVASDPIFVYGFSGLLILYAIGVMTIRRMIDLKV
ncbi:MAG: type II secretion system F family protein [Sphingomonadaceae bacterium]